MFPKSNFEVCENFRRLYWWLSCEIKSKLICMVRSHAVIYMIMNGIHKRLWWQLFPQILVNEQDISDVIIGISFQGCFVF